jgi:riboflavin kinase
MQVVLPGGPISYSLLLDFAVGTAAGYRATGKQVLMTNETMRFAGEVVSGLGQGTYFSSLEWLHRQLQAAFGFVPAPGTFNVRIAGADVARFQQLPQRSGVLIVPPDPAFCAAKCFRARLGAVAGALVIPLVPNYRSDVLEILAPVHLRDALRVADGDRVEVWIELPPESGATQRALD